MIDQIIIGVLGPAAVLMSQSITFRRWACLVGMFTQPFWFYAAYVAGQWGIFIAAFFYTGAWMLGIWNYWVKK